MFQKLFSPITIRSMGLRNRIVLPAMGTKYTNTREVTDQLLAFHAARAKGGTGLIITECTSVHSKSAPPRFLSISEDKYIPGMKRLTDEIHQYGAKAALQIWQGSIVVAGYPDVMVITPSDLPLSADVVIPGASTDLIEEVVHAFGEAARRAVLAGFDCIEVHGAHNYLLHSFLSGGINHRQDEYGGSLENRMRFPLKVIEEVRKNMPGDMPLFLRVSAFDDYLPGGLTIEEIIAFCKRAGALGVDVLDVSRGNVISNGIQFEVPPIDLPLGFNVDNAAHIRSETGMLTMGVGRINDPAFAEYLLDDNKVDLVGIGRAQLTDPEFCNKAKEGRLDDITRCIGCNQGCYDANERSDMPFVTCLRNPSCGREQEFALTPAKEKKKVLIAGGGVAGMEAAATLKARGHEPILAEESGALGGQFILAGLGLRKGEMKMAALHKGKKTREAGVQIKLETKVTPELLERVRPDVFINATGAKPFTPSLPGVSLPHVFSYTDVLLGRADPKGRVAVIGGGLVGLEIAELLTDRGCSVTILEMLPQIGGDLGTTRKVIVLENLQKAKTRMLTGAKCIEIKEGSVVYEQDERRLSLDCDAVVIATGAKSACADELKGKCEELGVEYHAIGDAVAPRRALEAIFEAAKLARTI